MPKLPTNGFPPGTPLALFLKQATWIGWEGCKVLCDHFSLFHGTFFNSSPLAFIIAVGRTWAASSTLCFEISSAYCPSLSGKSSTLHETLEHNSAKWSATWITRMAIFQVSNNMLPISICYLTLDTHIPSNIFFMMIYAFCKLIESFPTALLFSVWALTWNTFTAPISPNSPLRQSRLVLSCTLKLYHLKPLPNFKAAPNLLFVTSSPRFWKQNLVC